MLTDEQVAARRAVSIVALERRRQKRLTEAADNFATYRSLFAHFRRFGIPRYEKHYARWSRYWYRAFAIALTDALDRGLDLDEVDDVLATMVGNSS